MNLLAILLILDILAIQNNPNADVKYLNIDEIYIKFITKFSQNKDSVIINISEGFKYKLIHYSFSMNKAKIIDDGRIRMFYANPLPWEGGFLIIGKLNKKIIFLDHNGGYIRTERLEDYEGWDPELVFYEIDAILHDQIWVTAKRHAERTLVLCKLDLIDKKLTVRLEINDHDKFLQFWTGFEDKLIFITKETGEIVQVDPETNQVMSTLAPPSELIYKDPTRTPRLAKRRPYLSRIGSPMRLGNKLLFRNRMDKDQAGDKYPIQTLELSSDGTITHKPVLWIAEWKGKRLGWHWENQELFTETSEQ
jgi:hypothetical protein